MEWGSADLPEFQINGAEKKKRQLRNKTETCKRKKFAKRGSSKNSVIINWRS